MIKATYLNSMKREFHKIILITELDESGIRFFTMDNKMHTVNTMFKGLFSFEIP